jgi:hypothetical protein
MAVTIGKPWFEPKRFGYGTSPANWKGWLATALFVAMIALDVTRFHGAPRWGFGAILIAAFVALVYIKSSGEWRWRWGRQ